MISHDPVCNLLCIMRLTAHVDRSEVMLRGAVQVTLKNN